MNELILAEQIEKKLQERREPVVFPLTPTHRRELRELRNHNIGNLRERLRTIKTLKCEEYQKKYAAQIEAELQKYEGVCEKLNDDWKEFRKKINALIQNRKSLEEKSGADKFILSNSYGDLCCLNTIEGERSFRFDRKGKALSIAREEFEKKYGDKFAEVDKKIDIVVTQYEEAINFGDLEIVKKLYYIMKSADSFFEKVSAIKV